MKRLAVVLLMPVVLQFAIHAWRMVAKTIGEASVAAWRENYDSVIEAEFPRE